MLIGEVFVCSRAPKGKAFAWGIPKKLTRRGYPQERFTGEGFSRSSNLAAIIRLRRKGGVFSGPYMA